jgi:hypothetical protein
MASTHLIDGNLDALRRYEEEQEQGEELCNERNEFITWVVDGIREAIDTLGNPEELEDLSKAMDDAMEQLEELIGKLEGER